jgi:dihydrofolate synthase/folylpolyglutamate synthase
MKIQEALNRIYSMRQFDIKLGLDRIKELLESIGNPHSELKYIHIAGSNGKGSTASFIASILTEAGFKVGLYTSPHFVRFNERIRINGIEIDDYYIAAFINSIERLIDKHKPTFFEITTALAFKYFFDNQPDYVVLETGLGGRLDATNVVDPLASVITSISLEHTNILGKTIGKIAFEKAGIIKHNKPVFIGALPSDAIDVIKKRADELNSTLFMYNQFAQQTENSVSLTLGNKKYHIYKSGLRGIYQLHNSALTVKVLYELFGFLDNAIINKGLMNVTVNTGIEGRYEIVKDNPLLIFDAAHNPEAVSIFINEFSKEYKNYSERILIFGAMKDKDIGTMLNLLKPYFTTIYAVQPEYERAAAAEELVKIGNEAGLRLLELKDYNLVIDKFAKEAYGSCLVVLGSIYLLGEIKSKMDKKNLTNR